MTFWSVQSVIIEIPNHCPACPDCRITDQQAVTSRFADGRLKNMHLSMVALEWVGALLPILILILDPSALNTRRLAHILAILVICCWLVSRFCKWLGVAQYVWWPAQL